RPFVIVVEVDKRARVVLTRLTGGSQPGLAHPGSGSGRIRTCTSSRPDRQAAPYLSYTPWRARPRGILVVPWAASTDHRIQKPRGRPWQEGGLSVAWGRDAQAAQQGAGGAGAPCD